MSYDCFDLQKPSKAQVWPTKSENSLVFYEKQSSDRIAIKGQGRAIARASSRFIRQAFLAKILSYSLANIFRAMLVLYLLSSLVAFGQAPSTNGSASESARIDPNQLVLQALQRAVWGKSLTCRVQQKTNLFDDQMIGLGQYLHVGEGNGQVKLVMRFSTGKSQSTFIQVSDGRLLWSKTNDGTPPKRVYLDRVRSSLGSAVRNADSSANASIYLAIGGQAELLRGLYHRYRWFKIFSAELEGQNVWQLVGTLRTSMPEPNAMTLIDTRMVTSEPNPLVPSDVRLTLVRGTAADLVPLRLEYFRRELDERGQLAKFVRVSDIEYSDIQVGTHIDDNEFAFEDEAANIEDQTSEYMPLYPIANTTQPTLR